MENYKEENRQLKQTKALMAREAEEHRKDMAKLERKLDQLSKLEDECHILQEENQTLVKDSSALQEQLESMIMEKEELEYQTHEAVQALNDEREAKSLLELKMMEESGISSPVHRTRAEEWKEGEENSKEKIDSVIDDRERTHSESTPPPSDHRFDNAKLHSTPFPSAKEPPSLLSEMQDSFMAKADREELENLRRKLKELEETVSLFQKEKKVLEDTVAASSMRESKQVKEFENFKEEFSKGVREKDKAIEELNQRISIRNEQIEQFRSKLSTANAERTSMEIEVDGLSNEIQRLKVVSGIEVDKIQRECTQEQTKNIKLHSQVSVLEEQVAEYASTKERLEIIIFNSQNELTAMTDDIKSLQKVVVTLNVGDSRTSPVGGKPVVKRAFQMDGGEERAPLTNGGGGGGGGRKGGEGEGRAGGSEHDSPYYSLKIKQRKSSVQVHNETHTLLAIVTLQDQLRSVRSPLEQFTKVMLERSLAHSTRYNSTGSPLLPPSSSSPDHLGANRKSTLDLEAAISKLKSKLVHKTEELNNLRSIMKARATTAEVATSSLRSKLEGQARAYQAELAKLKYQIKILKKEKDEHLSLRTMYAKRCEDYIDEITRSKRLMEKRNQEYDELMVSLQKTIQRKLELSTELEEYKVEQERSVLIPKQLESSRV